jgi:hypothetical protein
LESMLFTLINYSKLLAHNGILVIEDIPSMDWVFLFKSIVSEKHKNNTNIYDLRHIKNMYDDIVFTYTNKDNNDDLCLCDYKIEYGIEKNKIDITHKVIAHSLHKEYIEIPDNDNIRNSLYGDPCYGIIKHIYINDSQRNNNVIKVSLNETKKLDFNLK